MAFPTNPSVDDTYTAASGVKYIYTDYGAWRVTTAISDAVSAEDDLNWTGTNTFAGGLYITESAAALADVAGDGQLWVKDDTPNALKFTDDAGSDFTVAMLEGTAPFTAAQTFAGNVFIRESAAAAADVAGDGQLWVKDDTPNALMFTDDAGTDFTVAMLEGAPTFTAGLQVGVDDDTPGLLSLYGGGTGESGGRLRVHNDADNDGTKEYFDIEATGGKLEIGPTDLPAVVIDAAGAVQLPEYGAGTVVSDASGNLTVTSGSTALPKNYLVNPGMRISQENGTTSGTATGYFPADQWEALHSNAGTLTYQQVASVTPGGSTHRSRMTVTAADASLAAGDYAVFEQKLEGKQVADLLFGSAGAKDVVARFMFKGPAGTYCAYLQNGDGNRSYVKEFTIAGGDANTDTLQTLSFPGDTSGTWDTDETHGMTFGISFAAGSTYQTTADAWAAGDFYGTSGADNGIGTVSEVFEVSDVGLYADPSGSNIAPDFVLEEIGQDLERCRRYWRFNDGLKGTWNSPDTTFQVPWPLREEEMRTTPSFTIEDGTAAVWAVPWFASSDPNRQQNLSSVSSSLEPDYLVFNVTDSSNKAFSTGTLAAGSFSMDARM
jgi:hypothetical protein